VASDLFPEVALVAEAFSLRPDAYARWLYGDEVPPNVTRLDWHAFNVAAVAFLAEAHKRAQEDAERKAKRGQGSGANKRAPRSRTSPVSASADDAPTSDPLASGTYTTMTLPETLFG